MKKKKIYLKNIEEIRLMYKSAQLVSKTLGEVAKLIRPGITTLEFDKIAEEFIRDHKGIPAFLGLYNFPNTLCTSPNEQIVHGIPNKKPLKDGDIISIDCGVILHGFYSDQSYTFEVGNSTNPKIKNMLKITKESLYKGIEMCKVGNRIGDIGYTIQKHCEKNGYSIVRELVGHALGKQIHESPSIPNYGKRGNGKKIQNGMTLAIEPMINYGNHQIILHNDGWTVSSKDKSYSAHFEHNIAIMNNKPILLSTFDYIYNALGISSQEEIPFKYCEN